MTLQARNVWRVTIGQSIFAQNCNDFSVISLKCQPERIEDLKAQYECIGNPYNESPKHWIGIDPNSAPDNLLQELTRNSYEIVKAKYASKRGH